MFDFSGYLPEEIRKAEEDLKVWINGSLLSLKLEQLPTVAERNQQVTEITESFFDAFGQYPSSSILYLLGNYILLSFIKSKSTVKQREENAFHTERQTKKRKKYERVKRDVLLDLQNVDNLYNIARPVRRCNPIE